MDAHNMATRGNGLTGCGTPPEESTAWPADVAHNNAHIQWITLNRNENRFISNKEDAIGPEVISSAFPNAMAA